MNKDEAKKVLIKISKTDKHDIGLCKKCQFNNENSEFEAMQKEIFNVIKENNLYDISVCSSRFLYLCIKYNVEKLSSFIEYAKNVTAEDSVFLDSEGSGCPCEYLNVLAKYLLKSGEILDIE